MRGTITLLFVLMIAFSPAQSNKSKKGKYVFELKETKIVQVGSADNLFFDYDNDGDQDLLIGGYNDQVLNGSKTHTLLYNNDGKGNFSVDKRSTFMGVEYGSMDIADMDNDGDLDLVITGQDLKRGAKFGVVIYKNDKGVFKKIKTIHPLDSYSYPTYAGFINANNDKHIDLVIEKDNNVEIYFNNKRGDFLMKSKLRGIEKAFAYGIVPFDIDKDGDDDILVQGEDENYEFTTKVYQNKLGRFSSVPHTFRNTYQGIIELVDLNGDEKEDVFMSNIGNSLEEVTGNKGAKNSFFYISKEDNSFTEVPSNIHKYNLGSSCFVDLDSDGDKDLIIMGSRRNLKRPNESVDAVDIYVNHNGTFKLFRQNAFQFLRQATIRATDIDGDGDNDVLITGFKDGDVPRTMLYFNKVK
ncbi:FG-GAP repeat domain-containing protein [Tenacibaculum sp. M341]|uniref:FG-GAP repeat domain-containing protein n=1 Tax=Tenacibaculum sp. M341 TaxID=2530339 RepID=UPI00104B435F|nr:VCBS repeat-containing protein [Tenacibaculum sp. M341]TCI84891.1 VCBS repeat-containing protein [Tenacibaculum sp. M341]